MVAEFKRICHWGPLIALFIINCITLTTLYITSMWFPANHSVLGFINHVIYVILIGLTLYNFFCAACIGPGYVPLGWNPPEESHKEMLQFCSVCNGYKAPRAHHCRKCGRCILKMDHHCPWINNCTGYRNHANFTLFLGSASFGAVHSLVLLVVGLYRGFHAYYYYELTGYYVHLTFNSFLMGVFSSGLSIGVIVAVGGLWVIQMKIILRNMTSIEEWIVAKAESRDRDDEFIFPYDLGRWQNFRQVFLVPFRSGLWWPVADGCDQFTLTNEQIKQKQEKRVRTRYYQCIKCYAGSWFPLWSYGCRTCWGFPCSDEPRIELNPGINLAVTRWKKHWMYGQVVNINELSQEPSADPERIRGWFPRTAVVPMTHCEPVTHCEPGQGGDTLDKKLK